MGLASQSTYHGLVLLSMIVPNLLNSCLGAFAFFGPGSYGSNGIYNKITQPAARGKLFFAGEATSTCHAYVNSSSILRKGF